jgi:hypothetical protein
MVAFHNLHPATPPSHWSGPASGAPPIPPPGVAGALGAVVTLFVSTAGLGVCDTGSGAGKVTPRRAKSSAAIRCGSRSTTSGHSIGNSANWQPMISSTRAHSIGQWSCPMAKCRPRFSNVDWRVLPPTRSLLTSR